MKADDCELAALKPKFARRGSLRVFSLVGGMVLLASPAVDDLMKRDAARTQLPHLVAAEIDAPHDVDWTRERPSQAKQASHLDSCDHDCRTWQHELAAHVSFDY